MSEFRYNATARDFEDALGEELAKTAKPEPVRHPPSEEESGLDRIAKGKTPLDEVRSIIEASRHKSAAEEIGEHRVRAKLAAIKSRGRDLVMGFLDKVKG